MGREAFALSDMGFLVTGIDMPMPKFIGKRLRPKN
jgi:hypothetical protein